MQKFTRALTREIELAGERLALTLDAEGVTIRPVGSRRPPCSLSWAALVQTATGQSELPAALAALRQGNRVTSVASPLKSPPTEALTPLFDRLDAWLAEHRSRYFQGLQGPASPEVLEALSRIIGQPLPDALRQWLGWHNGQQSDFIGTFWESFHLMSAAQIAAAWQDRAARAEPDWNPAWIPFLDDDQDDLLVLDPTESSVPVREVWRGRQEHPIVAPSLAVWLSRFVEDVEWGRYHEDPERGEFHRIRS